MEKERRGGFVRHVDDADLNEEQKVRAVERPCCRFLDGTPISYILSIDSNIDNPTEETEQRPTETGIHRLGASTKSFGIKPRHRWNGVDRSNGFEQEYFQRQNERKRQGAEVYSWSVYDT